MEINIQAYAMLIYKNKITLEQVPENLRDQVKTVVESLPHDQADL
jgi:hypothetical protein